MRNIRESFPNTTQLWTNYFEGIKHFLNPEGEKKGSSFNHLPQALLYIAKNPDLLIEAVTHGLLFFPIYTLLTPVALTMDLINKNKKNPLITTSTTS